MQASANSQTSLSAATVYTDHSHLLLERLYISIAVVQTTRRWLTQQQNAVVPDFPVLLKHWMHSVNTTNFTWKPASITMHIDHTLNFSPYIHVLTQLTNERLSRKHVTSVRNHVTTQSQWAWPTYVSGLLKSGSTTTDIPFIGQSSLIGRLSQRRTTHVLWYPKRLSSGPAVVQFVYGGHHHVCSYTSTSTTACAPVEDHQRLLPSMSASS